MPPFGEACVCNPWSHRDSFFFYRRGAVNLIPSTAQRRRWFEIVKREGTPSCVPAIFHFPYGERLSQEPHDTVLVRALLHFLQMCASRRQPVRLATAVPSFFSWPPLRLKTPRFRWFLTGTLRKWNPRPACGTAFSSAHNISSVCVCVCVVIILFRTASIKTASIKNQSACYKDNSSL